MPFAERVTVHSGRQSMPLFYNNTAGANNSETSHIFDTAQDWTRAGVKTLRLYLYGDPNNTDGQLYVKVNGIEKAVDVDLTVESWQEVNIGLVSFGADLQRVVSLAIVIKGTGSGIVYVDDIRLYP